MNKQRKAVALISGGLDSMLAAKTVMAQGIHVEGINFFYRFLRRRPYSCDSSQRPS
ncbi:hypothetical protein [Methylocucumis oryzae]|uniref:hypothetical protein n=1 Tax=Methylocucumis oryzae TaxID=1632867 RepID=UPI003083F394